jgi:hypothetical protein
MAGSTEQYGIVFELTPSTNGAWAETVLYNFGPPADGAGPGAGNLIIDAA